MNTEMRRVESSENWYTQQQLRFDRDLVRFRYLTVEPDLQGPHGLELGSGDGSMTAYLRKKFKLLTVVEGSKHLLDQIPFGNDLVKIHSLFEEFQPDEKFNSVILEHILEHVENPVQLLIDSKRHLEPGGKLFLGVPNAHSFHRLAAVKMGLLKDVFELNDRDHAVGHRRVYSWSTLSADILSAGLQIESITGIFFKPISNGQIDKNWDEKMIHGFYLLGKDFPENAAEISVVCKLGTD